MIQQTLFNIQLREPDICRRKHGGADTSVMAHARVQKARDRDEVLALIRAAGQAGATLDQVAARLNIGCNRLSGRFTELRRDGQIVDSGERRKTRTGSLARVYKETMR